MNCPRGHGRMFLIEGEPHIEGRIDYMMCVTCSTRHWLGHVPVPVEMENSRRVLYGPYMKQGRPRRIDTTICRCGNKLESDDYYCKTCRSIRNKDYREKAKIGDR